MATSRRRPCRLNNIQTKFKVGPFGSETGGEIFDDGIYSTVRQLVINYRSSNVDSIRIEYDDNGSSFWSDQHGSSLLSSKTETIKLDYPDEFLTSVHGHYDKLWYLRTNVCSLTFKSNKKSYGPYGKEVGRLFSIQVPGSKIVGFHGRSSHYMEIRAIGAHLKPLDHHENEKYLQSKPLELKDSSVVPVVQNASTPLLLDGYPSQTMLIKEDYDKVNKPISCVISNNQVQENEGNHCGTYAVGNTYNFHIKVLNLEFIKKKKGT